MEINQKEQCGLRGRIIVRTYKAGTLDLVEPLARHIQQYKRLLAVESYSKHLAEHVAAHIARLKDEIATIYRQRYIDTPVVQDNLIMQAPNVGKDLIVQRLVGTNTYSLNLQYGEIGTGSSTPAATDTALTTPTNRALVAFQEDFGTNVAIVQFFFTDATLATTTYYEFGTFVDGTSSIGSGQIFNHALFGTPYAKVAGQDTTIEVDITLT